MQVQLARVLAPNHHCKRVVKSERRTECEAELVFVELFYSAIDLRLVAARRFFENRGEGRTGVFGIEIDSSGQDRLMTYESARQIEAALDFEMSARFDDLREHLAENQLLSKILAANDNSISMAGATEDRQHESQDQHDAGSLFRTDAQ